MDTGKTRARRTAGHLVAAALSSLILVGPAAGKGPVIATQPAGSSPLAGVQDDRLTVDPDPAGRMRLVARTGAALVRVDLRWDLVAPTPPASPASPADPAYDWAAYDRVVAAARANRVQVLFSVYGTPGWARDPTVPLEARWENWTVRPRDPADYGAFAEAAARRYAPQGVRRWEAWNEPNISLFLRPQYQRRAGRWAPASPATYSGLLKAFYAAVKRADPRALVAGAVTAPAGDRCPDCPLDQPPLRVPPDDFVAALGAAGLRPPMDVVSHHPYPLSGPRDATPPGRTYVDLYNLDVLLRAIDRTYLKGKRLWLTEYGFATRVVPEYYTAFTPARQAAHIADAFRRMRANPRVGLLVYYLLQDHPRWASGLVEESGQPKRGHRAHALPFTILGGPGAVRRGTAVGLVGQARNARRAGEVLIQWRSGGRWVTIRRVRTSRDGSFRISLRPDATTTLRALWSGATRAGDTATDTSVPVTLRVR